MDSAETPGTLIVKLDDADMLKVAGVCFAVTVLGCLCALYLAKHF